MRDALEEQLAARLGALGETVGDDLPPPVDLEMQVERRRRHTRATRRWSSIGIAAAIVAAVAAVGIVHGTAGRGSLRIATSSTTLVPVRDSLQHGTVMLAARGHYVVSLDANGHTNATMVETKHGDIKYARATDDHRQLWYLSLKKGSKACGDVVRADIDGRTSKIVAHALAFDVSPDGSRLALYGAGDLAHDRCAPVSDQAAGEIAVVDLADSSSSFVAMDDVGSLRWSPDQSYLVATTCWERGCQFRRIDVPAVLGPPLLDELGTQSLFARNDVRSEAVEFGPDGLYVLRSAISAASNSKTSATQTITRYDMQTLVAPTTVLATGTRWHVSQVIPSAAGAYVVATPASKSPGLYRVVGGRLTRVRSLDSPGTLTPVTPLAGPG